METPSIPGSEPAFDAWNFRPDAGWEPQYDLVGYQIEATDGRVGKIDEWNHTTDESYLVVDTGPWIFGHKVLIPAGCVTHIDHGDRKVYVDRTKQQVKTAPDFDPDLYTEPTYRDKLSGYYQSTYRRD
jgi:hypothetical protein